MDRKDHSKRQRLSKPRFLVDNDASGTAGAVRALGWSVYPANPRASDAENVQTAVQKGLSILSMDGDYNRFTLQTLPFTVILSSKAQQSMSTASADLQVVHRLIREGDLQISPHQRVNVTGNDVRVKMLKGSELIEKRFPRRTTKKRKPK